MKVELKVLGEVIKGKFAIRMKKDEYNVEDLGDEYLITIKKYENTR